MDVTLLIWVVALTILVIVGVVWILDLQSRMSKLQRRNKTVVAGSGNVDENVTAAVENLASRLGETNARTERLVAHAQQTDETLAHSIQGYGLVRFRAFQDTGGDQSFSLALADGEGNGVVISALYGRDATRIYAKPIQGWLSPKPLGEEEEEAVAVARRRVLAQE